MPFYIYIIFSNKTNKYYTGYCENIASRLKKHNSKSTISTKSGIPWILVYSEVFETKTEAIIRENQIKRMKSRKYIEELIRNTNYRSNAVKG
jgi:putative endonuclease